MPQPGQPWSKSYDPEVPHTLNYPQITLCALLDQTAQQQPQKTALIFFGKSITYEQLRQHINSVAAALQQNGIKPGDLVALLLPNCPQYIISYYAILTIGAVVVPVNPLLTVSELVHVVQDSGVRAAICLDLLAEKLGQVQERCHAAGNTRLLENIYYTSLRDFLPFPLNVLYPLKQKLPPGVKARLAAGKKFTDLLKSSSPPEPVPPADIHHDTAVLIYTGGTTGKPKGIMLSHYALVVNAHQGIAWVQMSAREQDILLAVLPIFHGFGMSVCMNAPLLAGGTTVLLPRYDAGEILQTIHRHRPTLFAGVPTMYIGLINHPQLSRFDLSSLRGCFVGAAPMAPEIKRRFETLTGARLMEGYGLTEAVTAKSANPYRGVNKTGSIGIPFPDTLFRIVDVETGKQELSPREIGELVLQSPDLMLGYYNNPEETAATIRNGWLHTGDLGYMDEDGYFFIVERKKDLIITGGFNVYPREVEDVLYQHPAVQEASVIGVPDDYRGEAVKAFIALKEGASAEQDQIIDFCRQHLVAYKVPRQVEFCEELPKTAIGKILKRTLRERQSKQA